MRALLTCHTPAGSHSIASSSRPPRLPPLKSTLCRRRTRSRATVRRAARTRGSCFAGKARWRLTLHVRVRSGRQGDRHRQDAGAGPAGGAVYSGRDAGAAAAAATAPRTAEHTRACGLPLLRPPCTLTLAARLASHTAFCPATLPRHMTSSLHRAESDGQVLREVRDATWRQARRLGEGARLSPAAPPRHLHPRLARHLARRLLPHACVLTYGEPRQRASPLPLHYPTRCASPSAWTATSTRWRWSRRRGRREPSSRRWRGSRGWAGRASNRTVALAFL